MKEFFKLKYGVKVGSSVCVMCSESLNLKNAFFHLCDEFITSLLLNTKDVGFKKLLPLFRLSVDSEPTHNILLNDNGSRR